MLKSRYRVQDIIEYSGLEPDGLFLEGTGAMVLDHIDRVAYAARSDRTNPIALERFCTHFNFEPMVFDACDEQGLAVYHTNVLMCVATDFAMIGLDMITSERRRAEIVMRLERSGRDVIALTNDQIRRFAGNALELQGQSGRILALSATALAALDSDQVKAIGAFAEPVALDIPTIEKSRRFRAVYACGSSPDAALTEPVRCRLFSPGFAGILRPPAERARSMSPPERWHIPHCHRRERRSRR